MKQISKKSSAIFALFSLFFLIFANTPAHAEKGYRYWGYFQAAPGANTWTAAMTGPTVTLKDGAVEGWTFTASSNDIPATTPMADPDFAELCGSTPAVSGKIRVGIVVDFGTGDIAPTGETPKEVLIDCVTVPEKSTGLKVLESVLSVRADKSGLICGLAGYPATECGVEIDMPTPVIATADESDADESDDGKKSVESDDGFEFSEIAAVVLAIALAISIFFVIRKRKQ